MYIATALLRTVDQIKLYDYFLAQDLKPENLLLAENPTVDRPPIIKLTDFGIAKSIEGKTVRI